MGLTELNALLAKRRSTKSIAGAPVHAREVRDVLGAVFGVAPSGRRAYGSARARYPVSATLVVGNVDGLAAGAYPVGKGGVLQEVAAGEFRAVVAGTTIDGSWTATCPALLLLSADMTAADEEFGWQSNGRGGRFIAMEVGLIAQTVHLAAAAIDLGTVLIAGIQSGAARRLPDNVVPPGEELVAVMPLGRGAAEGPAASSGS